MGLPPHTKILIIDPNTDHFQELRQIIWREAPNCRVDHLIELTDLPLSTDREHSDLILYISTQDWETTLEASYAHGIEHVMPSTKAHLLLPKWIRLVSEKTSRPSSKLTEQSLVLNRTDPLHQQLAEPFDEETGFYQNKYFENLLKIKMQEVSKTQRTALLFYLKITSPSFDAHEFSTQLRSILDERIQIGRISSHVFCFFCDLESIETGSQLYLTLKGKLPHFPFLMSMHLFNKTLPLEQLWSLAQKALQEAQQHGFRVHIPNHEQIQQQQRQWQKQIEGALAKGHFKLVYQPIIRLQGASEPLYEVSLRLFNTDGQPLRAAEFFPIAINAHLLPQMDLWVLKNALQNLSENLSLFIQISLETLESEKNYLEIKRLISQSNHLSGLVFEISSQELKKNPKKIEEFCHFVSASGASTALTQVILSEVASSELSKTPFQFIKLDGSFTTTLNQTTLATTRKLILKLQHSHKKIIATRVESTHHLPLIWNLKIPYVQGYYFQAPGEQRDYDFQSEETHYF